MKNGNVKKDIILLSVLMIIVIFIFNSLILMNVNEERTEVYGTSVINDIRIKIKPSIDIARKLVDGQQVKDELTSELKRENAKLMILNINGQVIYKSGNLDVDINSLDESLYMDNSFLSSNKQLYKIAFPIVIGEVQKGNAIFYLNTSEIYKHRDRYIKTIEYLVLGEIAALLLLIMLIYLRIKMKIFKPLNNLKNAADRINSGDYNFEIMHSEGEVGQFAGAFELMRDEINDSMKIQKHMEKSRKELIAAISHDIRTPVATISAYIEAIKSGVCKDEERLTKYLEVIYKKSIELKKLTEDLFIHSQIDADKLSINKTEVYFKNFIEKLLEPVILEIENLGMKFIVKTAVPDVLVNIDSKRIGQVFLNIIENSKKYGKVNGKIDVYFRMDKSKIEVQIEDDGIGIKPEDMPYIFDKFYRGEKSRNKAYGGAGLGLSICKSIIEAHGGEIRIESLDGKGTKVFFSIDIAACG